MFRCQYHYNHIFFQYDRVYNNDNIFCVKKDALYAFNVLMSVFVFSRSEVVNKSKQRLHLEIHLQIVQFETVGLIHVAHKMTIGYSCENS